MTEQNFGQHPNDTILKPTKETYDVLQKAYEVFNKALFSSELPNCLITLQRRKRSYGYFCGNRFAREDGQLTDEIALNPSHFRERPVQEILATLAHEMVHLWQHHFGKAGRGRYHNKQWAEKMKKIGLQPTDTGEEGGKETGDQVHHFIIPSGKFERSVKRLLERGFVLAWMEQPRASESSSEEKNKEKSRESKSGKRVKYICSHGECELAAWAKHDARLICADHMSPMEPAA